ncbi:uncharacterized protein LOC135198261 [Macrobrachium nipponense]|uniref:uncharacterized protein LOC135198261 n=1 Tax=Macrobrachium nipponense TaxID=159736 RepID=UPI0030C7F722
MEKVKQSVVKPDHEYQVSLLFHGPGCLNVNYRNTISQLNSLERKLQKTHEYRTTYENVLQAYLEAEFIEDFPNSQMEGYGMPHFGVKKQSLTTSFLIVYNASSKSEGKHSLNDCLHPGPNTVEMLYDLLLKFRCYPHTLTSDISNAFHRVLLDPTDTKYVQFLWYKMLTQAFAFRVVVFGITNTLNLFQQVLRTHLGESGDGDH